MDYQDINKWVDEIYNLGMNVDCTYEKEQLDPFKPYIYAFQSICTDYFIKFSPKGFDPFYAYFQPAFNKKAPLIVHTPGYGGEMCFHPELSYDYNVLHINPLGYTTPSGKDMSKLTMGGLGTVLPDTILSGATKGYFNWLSNCVTAIKWALIQDNIIKDRVSFFGTSQGGGASLLLGSIFSNRGTQCVAADQPFLTNIKLAENRGAYSMGSNLTKNAEKEKKERAVYLIDTVNHLQRYNFPIILSSGGKDDACPADTIADLFSKLRGTKSYVHFDHLTHGYNREFISMCKSWFTMFA